MDVLIQRHQPIGDAIPSDCLVDGQAFSPALERASLAIAPGRYRLLFTFSARAERGELWSPDILHRLPLIDGVPGRSGLRIHAANEYEELVGCVALGLQRNGARLVRSRAAVITFVALLDAADKHKEESWITIAPALKELMKA